MRDPQELHERVDRDFTSHEADGVELEALRGRFRELAHHCVDRVPQGRELSLTLTKLEEAAFHAVSGIARP